MAYYAAFVIYLVHALLLLHTGVMLGQWEFWASTSCLVLMNLVAARLDLRSWRWRRY